MTQATTHERTTMTILRLNDIAMRAKTTKVSLNYATSVVPRETGLRDSGSTSAAKVGYVRQ